ncbi:hypothetical protein M378DRAFT_188510 [Amanita muscaria Koide BX008]|uniref:CxC2-like cysteine cluster KDZ transposase-associated domain-containing protein n=1 Tax=Amanita muscaria (strain Koide BX008) TaxID=946122 RepID=A0A0C2SS70_AMAMK|nr:hypothetical protein M378DRAFT_188510 [Amanita muscaria Koide BX008]
MKEIDVFLQELNRLEGRGDHKDRPSCRQCLTQEPSYRCRDCITGHLLCQTCIVTYHAHNPFHRLEVWNGSFFERVTLKSLGLRIQLGHPLGDPCPLPVPPSGNSFTVIDTSGVHEVGVDFCGCGIHGTTVQQLLRHRLYPATVQNPTTAATFRVLSHFQLLSFESKCSVYEYFQTLVRESDNTGLIKVKDRYKELLRMMHEWRHLRKLKRFGYSHHISDRSGLNSSEDPEEQFSCAILCPACPHPGINLPYRWEDAPKQTSWLYTLFLALDANFRLSRKGVSSKERDPCLTQGNGYFVKETDFLDHLESHKGQRQMPSTCVSHDAVNNADTKDARGLVVTGIGTVDCARHDMKRPNGVGDLQKGERYVNMDYFFYSSLRNTSIKNIVASYDIACQWSRNFKERMISSFPASWPVNKSDSVNIRFLVPKFHLPAHIEKCQQDYSFNYAKGVGRTEGEAPERGWADINGLSSSTREMGPGSRQDTLEDHMGAWNWRKVTAMGLTLLRKISTAITEKSVQHQAWRQLTSVLDPQQVSQWLREVEAWENDLSLPNPFESRTTDLSQANVRLSLAEQDARELQTNTNQFLSQSDISPSAMIYMGLDLEETIHKLQADEKSLGTHATPLQRARLQEKKNALHRKLTSWQEVQAIYIPAIASAVRTMGHTEDELRGTDFSVFGINLWLPSSIGEKAPWDRRLGEYEWLLRDAQARDALNGLRQNLRLRDFLLKKKKDWSCGVRQNTRLQTIISQALKKISGFATKYRITRTALSRLAPVLQKGHAWSAEFPLLRDEDIQGLPVQSLGEGRRVLSWIWTSHTVSDVSTEEPQLTDTLQIQWCRSRARAMRWSEEIQLLQEEMRRVLSYLSYFANLWSQRAATAATSSHQCQDSHVSEGLVAHALRQSKLRSSLHDHFAMLWCNVSLWVAGGEVPENVDQE